ncbi:hypothetical protein Desde_2532 [Desulfitobacterium dehalogenans ATCC 51507]|uniref:Citrate transporter n=1 Tax=Desulfitobacterium dehalogenans (strain ATCC 51507 / DSM 9161 / JW/IU-DC1) TaxID=756499 RepID=I4AA77_DESDJ|nr:hypothetical protein [Desulfitobacterium dehalogenans]AFM00862.1 hypothetical protein Desde_2532 [Desulfitobacterium dehalogenans ATCC 51507]
MLTLAHWVFILFILLIIATLIFRKPPVLPAAVGLFGVGLAESRNGIEAVQISFRALILATSNLLGVIVLIGLVVTLTQLLQKTKADQILVRPLLRIKSMSLAYWAVGIAMWLLTLLIWPTPALTLLGAVVIPILGRIGIHPIVLAVSLAVFGKGMGLSGDFIIQGAPSLVSKATGIPIGVLLSASFPVVILSGICGAGFGYITLKLFLKTEPGSAENQKPEGISENLLEKRKNGKTERQARFERGPLLAGIMALGYLGTVIVILIFKIHGDEASGLIGGVTLLILCICTILTEGRDAFSQFIIYVKDGLRYAMGVFTPIIIMSGFFFLGTAAGSEQVFLREGPGFFYDYTILLAEWIPLTKWTVVGLIVFIAILASLDGSGFSSLPLVGGIAIALSQVSQIPAVPLAVLGQVVGIWTGAALIPWGFVAVTSAVAGVEVQRLMKYTVPAYLAAILCALGWTLLQL